MTRYIHVRPLLWAFAIYSLLFTLELTLSLRQTGAQLVYPLDDTYISMSIAKNVALHGVWGVTPFEFTSASSTPFYIMLIAAAYWVTGVAPWWPAALAFAFGALAIVAAYAALPGGVARRTWGALAVIILTPLAPLAHTGMEHTLHIFLSILFVSRASRDISEKRPMDFGLLLLAPVLVLTRFEGLFLIGFTVVLLAYRRVFLLSATLLASATVPVLVYAVISMSHGWSLLPNSVLLKGNLLTADPLVSFFRVVFHAINLFRRAPHLIGVVASLLFVMFALRKQCLWNPARVLLLLTLAAVAAHLAFADVGWVYRYEAYLIALSAVSLIWSLPLMADRRSQIAVYGMLALAGGSLLLRSARIFGEMPSICEAVYSQQYQMARFVGRYFQHKSIAANDIGAINYMTDIRLFDLTGLADAEVLERKSQRTYTTQALLEESRRKGTDIAIVYDAWFSNSPVSLFGGPPLPSAWVRVGRWRCDVKGQLGGDTVSFYAVHPQEAADLAGKLKVFAPSLPPHVIAVEN